MMNRLFLLITFLLASCGGGGGGGEPAVPAGTTRIEFVLDVQHDPVTHLTRLNVLPLAGRPAGCLVLKAEACTPPASVQLWLDNNFGAEAGDQTIGPRPPNYGMVAGSLDTGTHIFKVAVIAPPDASGFSARREAVLTFNIFGPAQAGFSGEAPALSSSLTIDNTANVRVPVAFSVANSGAAQVGSSSVRFVLRPEGSNATISYDPATQKGTFVPDRAGRFAIEYTPVLQGGGAGLPAYAIVNVEPSVTSLTVTLEPSDANLDRPPPPPNTTRVGVFGRFNFTDNGFTSVEAFVDGASLGRLGQPNVQLQGFGAYRAGYAFDVPNTRIASGTHTLTVVVTDLAGLARTVTLPMQPAVSVSPGQSFTFTDSGP